MNRFYAIEIECEKIQADIRVNDVPIMHLPLSDKTVRSQTINRWIVPGNNAVQLSLVQTNPNLSETQSVHFELKVSSSDQTDDEFVNPMERLNFNWPVDEITEPQRTWDLTFEVDTQTASQFWYQAQPIDWTEMAQSKVIAIVQQLHGFLEQRDLAKLNDILSYKAKDTGTTHYLPPQTAQASQQQFFKELTTGFDWRMRPLDPDELEFHLVAGNRLVWVTGPGQQPVLKSQTKRGENLNLPLYLAPVAGEWTVVR